MTDSVPQFEVTDIEGTTIHFGGPSTVTTAINIPTVAGGVISEFLIMADPSNNPSSAKIEVSFDGGTSWYPLFNGGVLTWTPKGRLTQLKLKASGVGLKYYGLINREPT